MFDSIQLFGLATCRDHGCCLVSQGCCPAVVNALVCVYLVMVSNAVLPRKIHCDIFYTGNVKIPAAAWLQGYLKP